MIQSSNTTFTKGFRSECVFVEAGDNVMRTVTLGDIRNATAVDKLKFFMNSGTLVSGKITQYGIKL